MGNLSRTYTPDTAINYPSLPSPLPDTYKEGSGNPHWRENTRPILKNRHVDEVIEAATKLVNDSTDIFSNVYNSLGNINSLEPIITFGGSSALVDERFDEIILQLSELNDKINEYIETTSSQAMGIANTYIANHTESCVTKTEVYKNTTVYNETTGQNEVVEELFAYDHSCDADEHSRRYEIGSVCPYCGE